MVEDRPSARAISMMSPQDRYDRRRDDRFWEDGGSTPGWAKVVAVLIVAVGLGAAVAIFASRSGGSSKEVAQTVTVKRHVHRKPAANPETHETDVIPKPKHKQPASSAVNQTTKREAEQNAGGTVSGGGGGKFLGPDAEASFDSMAASLPAQVGMAVEPLGSEEVREFGDLLSSGHAWSSIKPAILATVLNEQGELGPEEEAWAEAAITASDNEAAASLFHTIEGRQGGLDGASVAVGGTIQSGGSTGTTVATAPPPPGAVSTYGQTEWPVGEAVRFYHGLARCEVTSPSATGYIEGLMEDVIPEQRWGLGEASFASGDRVGMKGGWGPDTEADGGYLVRQSGFVQSSQGGVAVAMIAIDESGSYPAGAADLTKMAQWLAGELKGLGPGFAACTG
jgi:hypothetical protein